MIRASKTAATLLRVDAKQTSTFSASLDGTALVTQSSRGAGKPRAARKELPDKQAARRAFDKAVHAKLRDGFVELHADPGVGPAWLFRAASPWGGATFDMSLDGTTLVAAGMKQGARGYVLRAYDLRTGRTETVDDVTPKGGRSQTFVHAVLLDATGEHVIYALDGETRRKRIATGHETVLARFDEHRDAQFNPFVVQPVFDAARARLLVFDAGDRARILDADGDTVFEQVVNTRTAETRARALSPSGKRVAVYVASRHLIYGHDDARKDKTHEVRVFDVDSGRLLRTLPAPYKIDGLGFTPDDRTLLVTQEYLQGPAFVDLETGRELFHFDDAFHTHRWMTARHFAYSPDGQWLAVASETLKLYDAATREAREMFDAEEGWMCWEIRRVAWSADSQRLAYAAGGDLFVVRL